jgi:hypothetical protein
MTNQQMRSYRYAQSYILTLHQHISVISVTIRVSCSKNTINIVKKYNTIFIYLTVCESNLHTQQTT